MHHNNMNNHPEKFKAQGPNEVCIIIENLEKMVVESPTPMGAKKI